MHHGRVTEQGALIRHRSAATFIRMTSSQLCWTAAALSAFFTTLGCEGEERSRVYSGAMVSSSISSSAQGAGGASNGAGAGGEPSFSTSSTGGAGGQGGEEPCGTELTGVLRDFKDSHPDFESKLGTDKGMVEALLGADGKPVYAGNPTTPTTHGKEAFDQWFRNVPGVNMALPFSLTLTKAAEGDVYSYENNAFFPIDGDGFGNEGRPHNYHFTFELRTTFRYQGGEVFKFTGDDDLFTFVNGRLAIDLGGVHGAQSQQVVLDDKAVEFGLELGKVYSLDFFFAERHTTQSNFRIDTSLSFIDCGNSDPK